MNKSEEASRATEYYYNTIDTLSSSSTLHASHPRGSDDQACSFVVIVVVVVVVVVDVVVVIIVVVRIRLSSVTVIVGGIRVVDGGRNAS